MKYKGTPRTKIVLRRRISEGNKLRYIRKKKHEKKRFKLNQDGKKEENINLLI